MIADLEHPSDHNIHEDVPYGRILMRNAFQCVEKCRKPRNLHPIQCSYKNRPEMTSELLCQEPGEKQGK